MYRFLILTGLIAIILPAQTRLESGGLRLLHGSTAYYPEAALKNGIEGTVSVDIELDPPVVDRLTERSRQPWPTGDEAEVHTRATVAAVMSREPLIVAPEDTIGEVAERMNALGVGSALVAEFGKLIGILTARDLLRVLAGRVHSSEARVRQWMTAQPIAVSEETSLDKATLLMTEHGIHHLPVVNGNQAVGMVGLRQTTRP